MDRKTITKLHNAAKIIEVDGDEGVQAATRVAGEEVAIALLIAHLRRASGSMETYPPNPNIELQVNRLLEGKGLIP